MREIMISIQPQWVEKILNGKKTIEIRKTMPKCELPCKVYIYCTKAKPYLYRIDDDNKFELTNKLRFEEDCFVKDFNVQNGKVVAEFTLNEVEEYGYVYSPAMLMQGYYTKRGKELNYSRTCLKLHEIEKYANDGHILPKPIYAWNIDNLKIYDKPKKLSEFKKTDCDCPFPYVWCPPCNNCNERDIKRPPQSWCYVQRSDL